MNTYIIEKQITLSPDIAIYLLHVGQNIHNINTSIIPHEQLTDINKYRFPHDRQKRLLARSFLYDYLNQNYGITDFNIHFNEHQKPFLTNVYNIHYSFSYSKDYVLVGLSRKKELGVYIEFIDPALEITDMAPVIMCPAELEKFNSLTSDPIAQRRFFYNLFSDKESIIKAFGTGLFYEVKNINILAGKKQTFGNAAYEFRHIEGMLDEYAIAVCQET